MKIEYKKITFDDLHPKMLQHFNRYQNVLKDWTRKDNEYILLPNPHIEDWNEEYKINKVNGCFTNILKNGGELYGAYDEENLIGFSGFDGTFIGSKNQYLQLVQMHVSYEYRGKKIGNRLFKLCIEGASKRNCKKLYIVASSSEDSQAFYRKIGCIEAEELIPHLFEDSPLDVHMEYLI